MALLAALCWAAVTFWPHTTHAQTTITGTAGNDSICVFFDTLSSQNVACVGGSPVAFGVTTPLLIEGLGGDDEITIYDTTAGPNACTCFCLGFPGRTNFVYGGGTVTIEGGAGDDEISGGNGIDILYGDGDDDLLIGHGGGDTLYGGDGNDIVLDYGGSPDDALYGEAGDDCMGDCSTAWPNVCGGGAGTNSQVSCGGCMSISFTGANCGYWCPE